MKIVLFLLLAAFGVAMSYFCCVRTPEPKPRPVSVKTLEALVGDTIAVQVRQTFRKTFQTAWHRGRLAELERQQGVLDRKNADVILRLKWEYDSIEFEKVLQIIQ